MRSSATRPTFTSPGCCSPGPRRLVRGHRSVDDIIIFDRAKGLSAFADIRRAARVARVRSRDQSAGLLQGGHRHEVHARAREARLRSRARARFQLAVHDASHSAARACNTCRISISNSSRRSTFPHEPVVWDLGPWPTERAWQRRVRRALRSADGVDRRRDQQAAKGLASRTLGRGRRRALVATSVLQPVLVGGRSPREVHAEQIIIERATHTPHSALGQRAAQPRRNSRWRRRSCSRRTPARCTWPSRSTGRSISLMGYTNPKRTGPISEVSRPHRRRVRRSRRGVSESRWRIGSTECRASRCATCSIASSGGGPTYQSAVSGPKA